MAGVSPRFWLTQNLLNTPDEGDERWSELVSILRSFQDTFNANTALFRRFNLTEAYPTDPRPGDLFFDYATGSLVVNFWTGTQWAPITFGSFTGQAITDDIHGALGRQTTGGNPLHTDGTTTQAGFISTSDKTKLDGIAPGATATPLSNANPADIGIPASGVSTSASRADHVHAHGNQAGGSLHAVATTSVAGFQSAADKVKQDNFRTPQTGIVAPTVTEFPNSGDYGVFRDTLLGVTYWCTNISGTLYTVVMT